MYESSMVMQCDMDKLEHFIWKWPFDPSDPKWLQIDIDPKT